MASSPPQIDQPCAAPPHIPAATPSLERAQADRLEYIRAREKTEQRSVLRGLLVLAMIALLFSMWRAGVGRVFVGRWWWP